MPAKAFSPQPVRALIPPSRRLAQQSIRAGTPNGAVLARLASLTAIVATLGLAAWIAMPGSPASTLTDWPSSGPKRVAAIAP